MILVRTHVHRLGCPSRNWLALFRYEWDYAKIKYISVDSVSTGTGAAKEAWRPKP